MNLANLFGLPSLDDVTQAARAAFRATLPGSNAWLWPNNVGPSAKVIAGAEWGAYQRLDFVGRQAFALTAEGSYLDLHGAQYNLPRKDATAAQGNIVITPTGAAAFAAGGTFSRGDGVSFVATAPVSVSSAVPLSVPVIGPAGALSTTMASTPMTIVSGLSGVGATGATAAVDANGLAGGADVEPDGAPFSRDLNTYRGRILFRKANPIMGGCPSDYVQWALTVPGVTRVFVERRYAGPGTVRVFPLFDDLFATAGGIPDPAHVALVASAIEPLAPAAALVTVSAATPAPIAVPVSHLNPGTGAAQIVVLAELADTIRRLGRVSGSDTAASSMPFLASSFSWLALWTENAVADAAGVIGADVVATDTVIPAGSIPVLGTVTFS